MRLPQDIADLLAVAIRDVIWYKNSVISFLKHCDVPRLLLKKVEAEYKAKTPTIKVIHSLLDDLDMWGDPGWVVAKSMLTKMTYWKGLAAVEPDRRDKAEKSLAALRLAMKDYNAQLEFETRKEREAREQAMQQDRESRGNISKADHEKLQSFRDKFDEVYNLKDERVRGDRFEALMSHIFSYYSERSEGSFKRTGEQVDGLFYFDKHWYVVEIRWKAEKAKAQDVSVLRDRASRSFGGDTKALFVSFNGFTQDCLDSVLGGDYERVILFDGADLRCVLDCQIAFDVLLAEKQLELVKNKRPFVSAFAIIARRRS